jgi:hypothetical protein
MLLSGSKPGAHAVRSVASPPFRLSDTDIRGSLHDVAKTPKRYAVPECVAAAAEVVKAVCHALIWGRSGRSRVLCTRSMENCPDIFVIVPAILHDPSQFASVRASL